VVGIHVGLSIPQINRLPRLRLLLDHQIPRCGTRHLEGRGRRLDPLNPLAQAEPPREPRPLPKLTPPRASRDVMIGRARIFTRNCAQFQRYNAAARRSSSCCTTSRFARPSQSAAGRRKAPSAFTLRRSSPPGDP